jgi:acyl carrier protein
MSGNLDFTEQEIKDIVGQFITKNFIFNHKNENISLYEKEIIDSTGVLELVDFLEEKFGIKIEDEELVPDNLDSIVKISVFIKRKIKNVS